ncbi:MAG: hypothetical protein K9M82_13575 [Deltaproteobacteria bacterium]|nr:hypothetical protein [Deltaproteobacteria bacterium]
MLYYTNHHLNFVRSASQIGLSSLGRCPFCRDELPDCDCGYGAAGGQKRAVRTRISRRRPGRKRLF